MSSPPRASALPKADLCQILVLLQGVLLVSDVDEVDDGLGRQELLLVQDVDVIVLPSAETNVLLRLKELLRGGQGGNVLGWDGGEKNEKRIRAERQ